MFPSESKDCLPILVPEGTITSALTVCPYIAIYKTDTFFSFQRTYRKKEPNAGRDAHEGWRQWEAGMATSSAPTVFPPFVRENVGVLVNEAPGVTAVSDGSTKATEGSTKDSLSDPTNRSGISVSVAKNTRGSSRKEKKQKDSVPRQVFIDGALSGYNNPSSLVLNEGLDLAEPGQQIDVLLSLGCGEVTGGASGESENGDRGLVFWLGQVVNLAFDVELQEAHVASLISRFSPQTMHVRLNPPTGGVSLTEHRPEVLQRMEVDTAQYLAENRYVLYFTKSRRLFCRLSARNYGLLHTAQVHCLPYMALGATRD